MKRYYICPRSVWEGNIELTGESWPRYALMAASSWIELPGLPGNDDHGGHILINTDFKSDWAEIAWHEHPEVARLSHPLTQAYLPLAHLHQKPEHSHKQFKEHHFHMLQAITARYGFSLDENHNLMHLHDCIRVPHPGMALNFY